jgi:hypothetical protein
LKDVLAGFIRSVADKFGATSIVVLDQLRESFPKELKLKIDFS